MKPYWTPPYYYGGTMPTGFLQPTGTAITNEYNLDALKQFMVTAQTAQKTQDK